MKKSNKINTPDIRTYGCALSAIGIGFEPESFLKETIFPPELVIFKGNLGFPKNFKDNRVSESESHSLKMLSEATFLTLKVSESGISATQHKEAILFLEKYRNEVLRLSKFLNVQQINLRCKLDKNEQFEEYPDELLKLGAACRLSCLM